VGRENVIYIHNGVLFIHKEGKTLFTRKWMKLEIVKLSKISQAEKDKYHMFSLLCGI
jgi:hypothetical protein